MDKDVVLIPDGLAVVMIFDPERKQGLEEEDTFVPMERNLKCAIGCCGHCQFGSSLICFCNTRALTLGDEIHHVRRWDDKCGTKHLM
jgi:hypothetical protein